MWLVIERLSVAGSSTGFLRRLALISVSLWAALGVTPAGAAIGLDFSPPSGAPGATVSARTRGASMSLVPARRLSLFLAPASFANEITSQDDPRLAPLGMLRADAAQVGRLTFTVPRIQPGEYIAVAHCTSCGSRGTVFTVGQFNVTPGILVTRPTLAALPVGCSPGEVGRVLDRFFNAVASSDLATIDSLWVTEDSSPGRPSASSPNEFQWYSMTEGAVGSPWRHRAIFDRPELLPYFAERSRRNEQIKLLSVAVGPESSRNGSIGFTVTFRREADDLPQRLGGRWRIGGGKGEVICARGQLRVLSVGMNDAQPDADLPRGWDLARAVPCPVQRGWSVRAGPPVACAEGPNAPAFATGFRITRTRIRLPTPCGLPTVERRLRSLLSAFNYGREPRARLFARGFHSNAFFQPRPTATFANRTRISNFVASRYRAGEGWTAMVLAMQRARSAREADYAVTLEIMYQGTTIGKRNALLSIDCASGLIRRWRAGPLLPL